jgi:hypothetical protein
VSSLSNTGDRQRDEHRAYHNQGAAPNSCPADVPCFTFVLFAVHWFPPMAALSTRDGVLVGCAWRSMRETLLSSEFWNKSDRLVFDGDSVCAEIPALLPNS